MDIRRLIVIEIAFHLNVCTRFYTKIDYENVECKIGAAFAKGGLNTDASGVSWEFYAQCERFFVGVLYPMMRLGLETKQHWMDFQGQIGFEEGENSSVCWKGGGDEYYASILQRLNAEIKIKCSHLPKKKIKFHQDNTQVYIYAVAMAKLHELRF